MDRISFLKKTGFINLLGNYEVLEAREPKFKHRFYYE